MANTVPTAASLPLHRRLLAPRQLAMAVARALASAVWLAGGFAFLAFYDIAQATPARRLLIPDRGEELALAAAFDFLPMLLCVALLAECWLVVAMALRLPWPACQMGLPGAAAAAAAALSALLFWDELDYGPKATLLAVGGGLVGFSGIGLQVFVWRLSSGPEDFEEDFPLPWYLALVLLSVSFLGALRGWTGPSPYLQTIFDYRRDHWESPGQPPLPAPDPAADTPLAAYGRFGAARGAFGKAGAVS